MSPGVAVHQGPGAAPRTALNGRRPFSERGDRRTTTGWQPDGAGAGVPAQPMGQGRCVAAVRQQAAATRGEREGGGAGGAMPCSPRSTSGTAGAFQPERRSERDACLVIARVRRMKKGEGDRSGSEA